MVDVRGADLAAPIRITATVALAVVSVLVLTSAAVHGRLLLLALPAAAVSLFVVVTRPVVAVGVMLAAGASVVPDPVVRLRFSGIQTDPVELIAFALLGAWLLWTATRSAASPSLAGPVAVIAAAIAVGCVVGSLSGEPRQVVEGPAKTFALYLLVLPLSAVFATPERRRILERLVVAVATGGSVYALVAQVGHLPLPGAIDRNLVTLGVSGGVQRVGLPLLAPVFLATVLVVARIIRFGSSPSRVATLIVYSLVLATTFDRSTWISLAVAVALAIRFVPTQRRPLRGTRIVVVALLAASTLFLVSSSGALGATAQAVVARLSSAVNPQVLHDSSYLDRANENQAAVQAIRRHPVFGVGIGTPYGARRSAYLDNPPRIVFFDRTFIHNSFLGAWLRLGLLGLIGIAWLMARTAKVAREQIASSPPDDAAITAAAAAALVGFAVQAIFAASLTIRPTIITVGVALALAAPPVAGRQPARAVPVSLSTEAA